MFLMNYTVLRITVIPVCPTRSLLAYNSHNQVIHPNDYFYPKHETYWLTVPSSSPPNCCNQYWKTSSSVHSPDWYLGWYSALYTPRRSDTVTSPVPLASSRSKARLMSSRRESDSGGWKQIYVFKFHFSNVCVYSCKHGPCSDQSIWKNNDKNMCSLIIITWGLLSCHQSIGPWCQNCHVKELAFVILMGKLNSEI